MNVSWVKEFQVKELLESGKSSIEIMRETQLPLNIIQKLERRYKHNITEIENIIIENSVPIWVKPSLLAKKCGYTSHHIYKIRIKLGLLSPNCPKKIWESNDEKALRKIFESASDSQLAKIFSTTINSIKCKRFRLNLRRKSVEAPSHHCSYCDKIFKSSRVTKHTQFCCKECMAKYRKEHSLKVMKECPFCHEKFPSYKSANHIFCSQKCYSDYVRLQRNPKKYESAKCQWCGKEFFAYYGGKKFCSRECSVSSHQSNPKKYEKKCPSCGKIFFVEATKRRQIFCSKECYLCKNTPDWTINELTILIEGYSNHKCLNELKLVLSRKTLRQIVLMANRLHLHKIFSKVHLCL